MENTGNPVVTIQMQGGGAMSIELYPDKAPISVANFVDLIQRGFYNGLKFHRVIENFVIQAGARSGDSVGEDLGFSIRGEFHNNGVATGLTHQRGTISMARTSVPDSASTQFFLCHQAVPHLDGQYAAFGKVVDGLDTLDAIACTPTGPGDDPVEPQIMEKVTVTLNSYELTTPERIGEFKG